MSFLVMKFVVMWAIFSFSSKKVKCKRLIRTWKEIDTSIIEIELDRNFEEFLSDKFLSFDFKSTAKKGEALMTFGYGYFENKNRFPRDSSDPWKTQAKKLKLATIKTVKFF